MTSKFIILLLITGAMLSFRITKNSTPLEMPSNMQYCPRYTFGNPRALEPITLITEKNWKQLLSGEWIFLLCSHLEQNCRELQMILSTMATTSMGCPDIGLAFRDLSMLSSLPIRFYVKGDVTIYHVFDGEFRRLSFIKDPKAFRDLLQLREWVGKQPLLFWRHPTSKLTRLMVYIFKSTLTLLDSDLFGYNAFLAIIIFLFTHASSLLFVLGFITLVLTVFSEQTCLFYNFLLSNVRKIIKLIKK